MMTDLLPHSPILQFALLLQICPLKRPSHNWTVRFAKLLEWVTSMWFVCTTANRLSSQRKTVRLNVFSSEQISVLHTMQPIAPDSYLYIYWELTCYVLTSLRFVAACACCDIKGDNIGIHPQLGTSRAEGDWSTRAIMFLTLSCCSSSMPGSSPLLFTQSLLEIPQNTSKMNTL